MPSPAPVHAAAHPAGFARAPFLVIWEATRACALACVHCRAAALARRDPRELTTQEAVALIDQVCAFGDEVRTSESPEVRRSALRSPGPRTSLPLFVLTGGDPMWRRDLREIVAYASSAGLSVALTPSGTGAATRKRLEELRDAGLTRVAVSFDGPDPDTHDAFRRVRGSFAYTMKIVEAAIDLGLSLQINTTVSRLTLPTLRLMADRVATLPLAMWAVFFLVQTGRGASLDQIDATECEEVLVWLHGLSRRASFAIKTTEAPHYRRVQWEQAGQTGLKSRSTSTAQRFGLGHVARGFGPADAAHGAGPAMRPTRAVNDGNGFVFVDHVGNICPSGFLPMARGNVRDGALVHTYRHDEVFRALRRPDDLEGRCGRCRFRALCGGSRSRAYSATGNPFASDPLCAYDPGPEVQDIVRSP